MMGIVWSILTFVGFIAVVAAVLYRTNRHGGKNQKDSASQQLRAFRAAGGSARLDNSGRWSGLV